MYTRVNDLFIACILCLSVIRFNVIVGHDILDPSLMEKIRNDAMLTTLGLFALLFLACGQDIKKASLGMALIGMCLWLDDIRAVYAVCACFALSLLVLLIASTSELEHVGDRVRKEEEEVSAIMGHGALHG